MHFLSLSRSTLPTRTPPVLSPCGTRKGRKAGNARKVLGGCRSFCGVHFLVLKISIMFGGSLEVKLPTIWTDGKAEVRRVQEEEEKRIEKIREEKERVQEEKKRTEKIREEKEREKKEDAGARKGGKVAIHYVFPMICGAGGSKSWIAKAAGAEPAGQMRDEKLHAVVARSTCRSQNAQSTPTPEHFSKLRCRKSARRCGAKQICE